MSGYFFEALDIGSERKTTTASFARKTGVTAEMLNFYNDTNTVPSGTDLQAVCSTARISAAELMLRMGRVDRHLLRAIQSHADTVYAIIQDGVPVPTIHEEEVEPVYTTPFGKLYQADCMRVMQGLDSDSIDLIFADPPFNLKKLYPSGIDDDLAEERYLDWCFEWLAECIRVLAPGGSLFLWNIPKWNTTFSEYLNGWLTFRHWISVDVKYSLPIQGRLYPSHYSLLYYCKGPKPKTFHPDRLPMQVCPDCKADLRDYGGYKDKMNPIGVNLMDVWYDIPPVRHSKYKKREGANELSIRLLDRIIEMASDEGDLIFDPFGGAGTTYAVAEIKQRRWIGVEIGPVDTIIDRLRNLREETQHLHAIRADYNCLFTLETLQERERRGLWTHETVRAPGANSRPQESAEQQILQLRERARAGFGSTSP
jgi:site-specific DNA-methyltransferase (adenine-specific)